MCEKPVESNSLECKLDLHLAGYFSGSVLGFGSQFRLIVSVVGKHSCLPLVVRICAGVRRDEDVVRFGRRSCFRGLALLSGNGLNEVVNHVLLLFLNNSAICLY